MIGDALVQLGQKELLIDMQETGEIHSRAIDGPRYIEARLSKLLVELIQNNFLKPSRWKK